MEKPLAEAMMKSACKGLVEALVGVGLIAAPLAGHATTIEVREGERYGPYLVNEAGQALYVFEADEPNTSNCFDACADVWPPVTVEQTLRAQEGVDPGKLGTIERKDGVRQVTYAGHPLYRYVQDRGWGQAQGQDAEGFGGEWYLVRPDGKKVAEEGAG